MSRVTADHEYEALTECRYGHPTETVADIRNVTAVYKDLHLYVDVYCFSNGDKKKLVNLSGTIPVVYEGNAYNIPVCIWLHDTHPKSPPKCLLRPSVTMMINPKCSCVDASGHVLLHCLSNWKLGWSNLTLVVEEMRAAFQRETPLYATSPNTVQTPSPARRSQSPVIAGAHSPVRFLDPYRQHFPDASLPYPRSPTTQHMAASSARTTPVSALQAAGDNTPPTRTRHSYSDPGTERGVRKSYTEELLDLGITFEAPSSHSSSSKNPFIQTNSATVLNATSSSTSDLDDLFKSLQLEKVAKAYQLDTNERALSPMWDKSGGDTDAISGDGDPMTGDRLVDNHQTVEVTQLPQGVNPGRMRNKLTIYFQSRHNGGGEVLDVQYPTEEPHQARVTFLDPRDAERVLTQAERVITVNEQHFPVQVKRVDHTQVPVPDGVPWDKANMFRSLLSLEGRSFAPEDVLEAVQSCRDLPSALRYLSHECPICREQVSFSKIITMTHCPCAFCESCFKAYFSSAIKEKSITSLVCPICGLPDVHGPGHMEVAMDYFNLLDTQIRHYLDPQTHELFQRKLRDCALQRMPNFRWCAHCSFGLLHEADRLRMDCPNCKKSTCSNCKSPWVSQHEGLSCEKFRMWQAQNNPEYQAARLDHLLSRNKIDCPKCKFRFYLSKGGCLHFKCTQCQYEFCGGCKRPFRLGSACDFSEECRTKGLHAHHPRDCFYHLRDWTVLRLLQLLQHHKVKVTIHPRVRGRGNPEERDQRGLCGVLEQREVGAQREEPCGEPAPVQYNGYCVRHYKECLVELINQHHLDPVVLFGRAEMVAELQRWKHPVPHTNPQEAEAEYLERLRKAVRQISLIGQRTLVEKSGISPSASCPSLGTHWGTAQNNPARGLPQDSQVLLLLND
ncbi:hypothetical protein JZ751_000791 [Albula glossodonta]|uniref:Uncharacterized protein n=1 Tax=Albula glossodonta TaxID=121402 RepID=A0A8T2PWX5_9TELE|nr:hypothetical protein JZ751_000791 [Albula glossodonta]